MRIVMITKFLPLPADSGGKQRSAAVLRHLTEVGDVTICGFDDGTADHDAFRDLGVQVRCAPRPGGFDTLLGIARTRSISAGRFASRALLREIREATATPPDCLVVSYGQLAPYAALVRARHKVLDLHNMESALLRSYASSAGPITSIPARYESAVMRRIERVALGRYDTISVVSEADRLRLPGAHERVLVCPNGWSPAPPKPMGLEPVVAFIALMGWTPNADAAAWLAQEVWPLVRRAAPDARLLLVGRDPTPAVRSLAASDITVTGTVPSVAPYLEEARVAVAPLRAGGGSRLKILEALDAGRPVIATQVGAEGLESLIGRGIVIADAPQDFADAIVGLLRDRAEAQRLGAIGNEAVTAEYSWDRTLAPMIDDIRQHAAG